MSWKEWVCFVHSCPMPGFYEGHSSLCHSCPLGRASLRWVVSFTAENFQIGFLFIPFQIPTPSSSLQHSKMAKTKGPKSALSRKRVNEGELHQSKGPKNPKSKGSKNLKSKSKPLPQRTSSSHRYALRHPYGRFESAPVPTSTMEVSSDSDQPETASTRAQGTSPSAPPESSPIPVEPSDPVIPALPPSPSPSPSGNFLEGRISLYDAYFSRRPVHLERKVDFSHFTAEFSFIKEIFENRGWVGLGNIQGMASIDLVREFYTNFDQISLDDGCFDTLVHGLPLRITVDILASFLKVSRTPDSIYPNIDWTSLPP